MIFTIHHTCSKQGGRESVLKSAPFPSTVSKINQPFLGSGYYFWDYNLSYAKTWGKSHYEGRFFVLETDIYISHESEVYLDLAGNRKHLEHFVNLLQEFNLVHKDGTKGIDLCFIIEYLRKNFPEDVFPFKIIRAVDYTNDDLRGVKIAFNDKTASYTILNPRILFSFTSKKDIPIVKDTFITFASK